MSSSSGGSCCKSKKAAAATAASAASASSALAAASAAAAAGGDGDDDAAANGDEINVSGTSTDDEGRYDGEDGGEEDGLPPKSRTTIPELQAYLDSLVELASADKKEEFVRSFVPLDLTEEELLGFLASFNDGEEGAAAWSNITAEIIAIARGTGVTDVVEGIDEVVYCFEHPELPDCDREVVFEKRQDQWRAQG
eukprot:g2702.t1